MTPRTRWLILAFSLVGLAFAGYAAYVHYRLLTEPNYVSPCDINARFNCSELYLSQYGSVRGVPVALGGVVWFAAIALIALFSSPGDRPSDDAGGAYIFALATIGLATIFYFAYISYFVLKTACLLCIGTYVSVIAIFITSGTAKSKTSALPGRFFRDLRALFVDPLRMVTMLVFLAGSVSLVAAFPKEGQSTAAAAAGATSAAGDDAEKKFVDAWAKWAQERRVDLGIPADGAKVVVVKFNDWQCPSCKAAYYAYKPLFEKYEQSSPGSVKYVTKDYPLSNKCNFNVPQVVHPAPCEASAAVRLARGVGKEDEMVTWLFGNQAAQPADVAAQVKKMLNLDLAREYPTVLPDIKRDAADGGALKVQFTPTYYVNGVLAQMEGGGWLPPQYFDFAIQYELKKAADAGAGRSGGK